MTIALDQDSRFRATCWHEASHTVVAHALGGRLGPVIVALPGYLVDGCHGVAYSACDNPADEATVMLAGVVGASFGAGLEYISIDPTPVKLAKERATHKKAVLTITKDADPPATCADLPALVESMQAGACVDRSRALKLCQKSCAHEKDARELYFALESRAADLVAGNLSKIEVVAYVLERKLTLGKADLVALLGTPPPPPDKPTVSGLRAMGGRW